MNRALFWLFLPLAYSCAPKRVDIAVRGAAIGPADWDGMGTSGPMVSGAAAAALAAYNPYAAVAQPILDSVFTAYAPPDVFGTVAVYSDDPAINGAVVSLPQVDNSFVPLWGAVQFTRVPLNKKTALAVSLLDYDPLNGNDTVADAIVRVEDLRRALRAGQPLRLDFQDATGGQLVWLAVEVAPTRAQ